MNKAYYVYIITNNNNTVLYTGITNNLKKRIYEHKKKLIKGFSNKYNLNKLVYYEYCDDVNSSINREKEIKGWKRSKKIDLINNFNADWKDLYNAL